ncbi:hypothetical protein BGZ73_008484 [Actinomortierella ambigua]|nr:hypothetical protein BGZ73_008484 [Actinomortierella ambigua]
MASELTCEHPEPHVAHNGEQVETSPVRLISPSRAVAFVYYDGDSDSESNEKTPASPRQSLFRNTAQKLACGLCFNPIKTTSTDYRDLVHTPGDELEATADGENPYFLTADNIQAAGIGAEQALIAPREAPVFEVTVEETLQDDASVAFATPVADEGEEGIKAEAVATIATLEESTTPALVRISHSSSSSVALSSSTAAPVVTTSQSQTSVQSANSTATATGATATITTSTSTSSAASSPKLIPAKSSTSTGSSSPSPLMERINKFKKMLNTRSPSSSFKVEALQVSEPVDVTPPPPVPAAAPNTKETILSRDVKVKVLPTTTVQTEEQDATTTKTTTTTTTTTTSNLDGGETIVRIVRERHSVDRLDTPLLLGTSVPSSEDMKPDEVSLLSSTAPSSLPTEWTIKKTSTVMTTSHVPTLPPVADEMLAGTPPSHTSVHPLDAPATKKESRYRLSLDLRKGNKHKTSAVGTDNSPAAKQQQHEQKPVTINRVTRTSSTMSSTTAEGASEPGSLTSIHEHMVQAAPIQEDKPKKRKSVIKKIGKILNPATKRRQGSMVLEGSVGLTEEPEVLDRRSSF